MPSPKDKDAKVHVKKRVSKACDCCRKSKTKCDGMRPCTRCLQDNKICTYMSKKKADQLYPASYVDLLETRVSILVQSLTSILEKSRHGEKELLRFCSDTSLLNDEGEFDINKVICKLLPNEKLDNLAESNTSYSLDDITHVTSPGSSSSTTSAATTTTAATSMGSNTSSTSLNNSNNSSINHTYNHNHAPHSSSTVAALNQVSRNRSPSPKNFQLSKTRRHSENHIHKTSSSNGKKHSHSHLSELQTRLSISSSNSSLIDENPLQSNSSSSIELLNKNQRSSTLDSILYNPGSLNEADITEFENLNFSDTNTSSTLMSPVYSIDNELDQQPPVQIENTFNELFGTNTWPIDNKIPNNTNNNTAMANSHNSNTNTISDSRSTISSTSNNLPSAGGRPFEFYGFNWDENQLTSVSQVKKELTTLPVEMGDGYN